MYLPSTDDEITGIANYLDQQLEAIRASAVGLTEAQAASTPCRSALSVAGIVKHTVYGLRGAVDRLRNGVPPTFDPASIQSHYESFALSDGQTVSGLLAELDSLRAELRAVVLATDPDTDALESAAPWLGIADQRPIRQRFYLLHLLEEYARHAGHADIIREQIDGVSIASLVLTRDGAPANDFFQPYQPVEGTIGLT